LMAAGQFCLFLSGSYYQNHELAMALMFVGLAVLIFGVGFFKPNISTMVGQLYPPADRRIDAAFTIFYMGINLGACLGPLVCGFLGESYGADQQPLPQYFRCGFLAACIGMLISVPVFVAFKNRFLVTPDGQQIGAEPNKLRDLQAGTSRGSRSRNWPSGAACSWCCSFFFITALLSASSPTPC